jgi:hypothetical protein
VDFTADCAAALLGRSPRVLHRLNPTVRFLLESVLHKGYCPLFTSRSARFERVGGEGQTNEGLDV